MSTPPVPPSNQGPPQQPGYQPPQQGYYPPQPQGYGAPQPPAKKQNNILGLIALGAAVLGTVLSWIPGIVILGWILLPVGFILGIIAVCLKNKVKWSGFTAIGVSVIGTIIAIIVAATMFVGFFVDAVDESIKESKPTARPAQTAEASTAPEESTPAEPEQGTRENPYPFDAEISNDEWTIKFTNFVADANQLVAETDSWNEAPGENEKYVLLETSAEYTGEGEGWSGNVQLDYVADNGTVVSTWDTLTYGFDPQFGNANLYAGGVDAGKSVFLVPADVPGLIRVQLDMFGDDGVFVALPQ